MSGSACEADKGAEACWSRAPLGSLVKIRSGSTPSKSRPEYWGGVRPWISAKDMKTFEVRTSIDTLTDAGFEAATTAAKGSILVLTRGMTLFRDVPVCVAGAPVAFNQDVKALVPVVANVDPGYLAYFLRARRNRLLSLVDTAGHGTGRLDTAALMGVLIDLPPLDRQKEIAEALATWDEAIEKTERLLTAKRMHVQGLIHEMTRSSALQQAITGRLGDFCTLSKGSGLSKEAVQPDGAYKCILYGELYTVYGEVVEHVASRTNAKSVVSRGDEVLIPASTTTTGEDLANATALHEPGVLLGGDINILRPKRPDVYDAEYLAYYLTHAKKREIVRLAQGSTIVHLYGRDIASLTVELPSLEAQRHAAAALAQARREIDLLMQLKQQYEVQRQGLEQRLLTPPNASRAAS